MTLTCERRLFKSGRTTLRLVLQATEKVYDALRLETMRRSVREMRRTGVWVSQYVLVLFQVGRAASCQAHVMGFLFSLSVCVSSPTTSVLGRGRKSLWVVCI